MELARYGPRALPPYLRGQVAHMVRTTEGAELFSVADPSMPGEWLCVFDVACRASERSASPERNIAFDPLKAYGLDDDPARIPNEGLLGSPFNYSLEKYKDFLFRDDKDLNGERNSDAEDHSTKDQGMSPRLAHLMEWALGRMDDPCVAWWLARQHSLHPDCLDALDKRLQEIDLCAKARRTWMLIRETLPDQRRREWWSHAWINLQKRIKKEGGWTEDVLQAFDADMRPMLVRYRPWGLYESMPPLEGWDDVDQEHVVRWEIRLPERMPGMPKIPDEALPDVFRIAEGHLIQAADLYRKIGTEGCWGTPTCYPKREIVGEEFNKFQVSYFRWFQGLMERMLKKYPQVLRSRVLGWNPKLRFIRKLILFALCKNQLFDADEVANIVLGFGQSDLWDCDVRRELLFLLEDRRSDFSNEKREAIIDRLLLGPAKMDHWSDAKYLKFKVENAAEYVRYLDLHGFPLTRAQSHCLTTLISSIPDWTDWRARSIVFERGIEEVRPAQTDISPADLCSIPVSEIIECIRIEDEKGVGMLTGYKLFEGLVAESRKRAFLALLYEAKRGELSGRLLACLSVELGLCRGLTDGPGSFT